MSLYQDLKDEVFAEFYNQQKLVEWYKKQEMYQIGRPVTWNSEVQEDYLQDREYLDKETIGGIFNWYYWMEEMNPSYLDKLEKDKEIYDEIGDAIFEMPEYLNINHRRRMMRIEEFFKLQVYYDHIPNYLDYEKYFVDLQPNIWDDGSYEEDAFDGEWEAAGNIDCEW